MQRFLEIFTSLAGNTSCAGRPYRQRQRDSSRQVQRFKLDLSNALSPASQPPARTRHDRPTPDRYDQQVSRRQREVPPLSTCADVPEGGVDSQG